VLDVVAGPRFAGACDVATLWGPLLHCRATAGGDVRFDAWTLLNAITLTGYSTEDIDGDGLRAATDALLRQDFLA